jgi:hypothetical protein
MRRRPLPSRHPTLPSRLDDEAGTGNDRFRSEVEIAKTDFADLGITLEIAFAMKSPGFGRNQNLTARSIVFYGILHQVLQRQRNHFLVSVHRKSFGNIGFDLKVILSAEDPGIFQASVEQFAQVELCRA